MPKLTGLFQGLVNVPFWEYWTSPYSSHLVDHIPNGWVMFNGDMTNDPCIHCIHVQKARLFWCENQGTRVAGPRSSYPAAIAATSDDTGPLPLGGEPMVLEVSLNHMGVFGNGNPPILQFYSFDRENAD